MQTYSN